MNNNKILKKLRLSWKLHLGKNKGNSLTTLYRERGLKYNIYNIDYKYFNYGNKATSAIIIDINYLPFKSIYVGLILYLNGISKGYFNNIIISQNNIKGDLISIGNSAPDREGNSKKLKDIPIGSYIYNIERYPHKGANIIRTKGSYGQLLDIKRKYAYILLPSKKIIKILNLCFCTLGTIFYKQYNFFNQFKAGTSRLRGIRPKVRGVAMNPCDHAHGGGTGKASVGKKIIFSRWGYSVKKNKKTSKSKILVLRN